MPLRSSEGLWENRVMGAESPFNTMGNNLGARIILLMAIKKRFGARLNRKGCVLAMIRSFEAR